MFYRGIEDFSFDRWIQIWKVLYLDVCSMCYMFRPRIGSGSHKTSLVISFLAFHICLHDFTWCLLEICYAILGFTYSKYILYFVSNVHIYHHFEIFIIQKKGLHICLCGDIRLMCFWCHRLFFWIWSDERWYPCSILRFVVVVIMRLVVS